MANTRIDRLPSPSFPLSTLSFPFCLQESHSLLDGEPPSPSRPSSSRSSRPSPKKGRLFGPGKLGKTTEEEQQDLDPSEVTSHPSEPTPALAIVEEDKGDEHEKVISVSGSPPHETKMRQASKGAHGVEIKKADQEDGGGRLAASTPFPATEGATDEDKSTNREETSTKVADPVPPDPDIAQPKSTSSVVESPAVVEDPPAPLDKPKRASADYLLPFPGMRRGSDSSVEQEKGLKRKLGDRAVSESREAESVGKKASKKDVTDAATTCAVGTKRARDEGNKDPNPKEPKRPSPPPDKTVKTETEKPPVVSSSGVVSVCISDLDQLIDRPGRSGSWHMLTFLLSCPPRKPRVPSLQRDQGRMPTRMQIPERLNVLLHLQKRNRSKSRSQRPQGMDSWRLPPRNLRSHLSKAPACLGLPLLPQKLQLRHRHHPLRGPVECARQ